MNAMLQALLSCRASREYFATAAGPMGDLFRTMETPGPPVDPSGAMKHVTAALAAASDSPAGVAADTGEHLHMMLDVIKDAAFGKLFAHSYSATVECQTCRTVSKSPNDVGYALEMPADGVFSASHVMAQHLDVADYACDTCKVRRQARRSVLLRYAPRVFVMTFARAPSMAPGLPPSFEIPAIGRAPFVYSLMATVYHTGGHYFADAVRVDGPACLDDSSVGPPRGAGAGAGVYFAFYERE
jgi:ubiquitin C-terminal hydrolase